MDNNEYKEPLNKDGWSAHYNIESLNNVVEGIETGRVSVWSKEVEKICSGSVLEIGCGTGESSLWLAKNGLNVTAIDYTDASVELVKAAADKLKLSNLDIMKCDATKELPFKEKQFDYIFQAGLLEHFRTDDQINLLKIWSKYCKNMVSLIPNASSVPYRIGKQIKETKGTWEYGLEIPKHSLKEEFIKAGIDVEAEYTIGTECALTLLPKYHFVKIFYKLLKRAGYNLDDYMQGFLLVTIGKCN